MTPDCVLPTKSLPCRCVSFSSFSVRARSNPPESSAPFGSQTSTRSPAVTPSSRRPAAAALAAVCASANDHSSPVSVNVAGRMMFQRIMGKASFAKLHDPLVLPGLGVRGGLHGRGKRAPARRLENGR